MTASMNESEADVDVNCDGGTASTFFNNSALIIRLGLSLAGLLSNSGVVLTVMFGKVTQRKNAAKVISSMCVCNIIYLFFIISVAIPMRSIHSIGDSIKSFCLQCQLIQFGSNAPKAVLTAHHMLVAVDTFWLIKKPFEYTTLSGVYLKQFWVLSWVLPSCYVLLFDSLTLCFYETINLHHCTPRAQQMRSLLPEFINILVNFTFYSVALGYIMFLYAQVFSEALGRIRRRNFSQGERRASLTSDSALACLETFKQEVRLIRGFIALVVAALMTASIRNSYYIVCIIVGCDQSCLSGGWWRDMTLSTVTAVCLLMMTCFTPYAYFYRNPLYLKAFHRLIREKVRGQGPSVNANRSKEKKEKHEMC